PDPQEEEENRLGANTVGGFSKVNLSFNAVLSLTERLSFSTYFRGQKSLSGNLDTSKQLGLTGYYGVRTFDEGVAGANRYIVTPELKYALPDIYRYKHSIGVFTDIGAVWLEDGSYTTIQKSRTQLNDVGFGYYASYEYLPGRFFLLKAQVAHTYGSNGGAE